MPFSMETERLTLQLWEESDAAGYRQLVGERGNEPPTLDAARVEIRDARRNAAGRGIHLMTLRLRGDDEFLGYCGLIIGRASLDEPEIAYELLRRAHGRGYATEAAAAIVDAARATGRTRLWSTVGSWNTASFRVLEKVGFRRDRTATDERGEFVWNVLDL
jgi:RimJ/RimL family protein N-acetyltransferase